jgi:hypothetical protein
VTPEQIEQIERERREREDEYVLLLLLLLALGFSQGGDDRLTFLRRLLLTLGVITIAESMADSHLAAFAILAIGAQATGRDELIRQYTPMAREAADAMVDTLTAETARAGGDVSEGLRLAGYSRSNSTGLELGAERNVVTASNAGLFEGAAAKFGLDAILGFRHVSFLDEVTTDICRERHGLSLPTAHRYWRDNWVSLHFHCRSWIVPLVEPFTPSETLPTTPPMDGFGRAPLPVLMLLDRVGRGVAA